VTDSTLIQGEEYRERTRYRVDLAAYMRTCDTNYLRLLKLIPALASERGRFCGAAPAELPSWQFLIGRKDNGRPPVSIRLQLLEAFPYTTTLKIAAHSGFPAWSTAPVILLRMYHDAATAEPLSYQGHRQIPARCEVPNTTMYHHDEKRQINEFLADWLRLCLNSGINTKTSDILCID